MSHELYKLYPYPLGPCETCGEREALNRHHRDRDTGNNDRENIAFLCLPCHKLEHPNGFIVFAPDGDGSYVGRRAS